MIFGSGPLRGWTITAGPDPERTARGAFLQALRLEGDEAALWRLLDWRPSEDSPPLARLVAGAILDRYAELVRAHAPMREPAAETAEWLAARFPGLDEPPDCGPLCWACGGYMPADGEGDTCPECGWRRRVPVTEPAPGTVTCWACGEPGATPGQACAACGAEWEARLEAMTGDGPDPVALAKGRRAVAGTLAFLRGLAGAENTREGGGQDAVSLDSPDPEAGASPADEPAPCPSEPTDDEPAPVPIQGGPPLKVPPLQVPDAPPADLDPTWAKRWHLARACAGQADYTARDRRGQALGRACELCLGQVIPGQRLRRKSGTSSRVAHDLCVRVVLADPNVSQQALRLLHGASA